MFEELHRDKKQIEEQEKRYLRWKLSVPAMSCQDKNCCCITILSINIDIFWNAKSKCLKKLLN